MLLKLGHEVVFHSSEELAVSGVGIWSPIVTLHHQIPVQVIPEDETLRSSVDKEVGQRRFWQLFIPIVMLELERLYELQEILKQFFISSFPQAVNRIPTNDRVVESGAKKFQGCIDIDFDPIWYQINRLPSLVRAVPICRSHKLCKRSLISAQVMAELPDNELLLRIEVLGWTIGHDLIKLISNLSIRLLIPVHRCIALALRQPPMFRFTRVLLLELLWVVNANQSVFIVIFHVKSTSYTRSEPDLGRWLFQRCVRRTRSMHEFFDGLGRFILEIGKDNWKVPPREFHI